MRAVLPAVLMSLLATPCLAQSFDNFQVVDFPKATNTYIFAVNDVGQYVGQFADAAHAGHAFLFDGRQLSVLDADGVIGTASRSSAFSINNFGQIAGSYTDAAGKKHGFVDSFGHVATLDYPGAVSTAAYGINDEGDVIGVYHDSAGAVHAFRLHGGVYRTDDLTAAGITVPLAINDLGEIVGELTPDADTTGQGFRQRGGGFTTFDAPGAPANSTYLISINNRDQMIGVWFDAAGDANNFVVSESGKVTQFTLPASFAALAVSAQTINDLDVLVGWFTDAGGDHGFIARRR
jgi:probable HAF family extracellular repeat protein